MNSVIISGNLGHTPELKRLRNGTAMVSGSIAYNKTINGTKQTMWFNFKAFNGTAELIAKNFSKGEKIGLIGSLDAREYKDRNGDAKTAIEILVNSIEFYGNGSPKVKDSGAEGFTEVNTDDGDLPF